MRFAIPFLAVYSAAQSIPAEMRDALVSEYRFSAVDLAKAETGRAVAKFVPTGNPSDVRMAGVVLIRVSSSDFIKAFRDIKNFQTGREVRHTGMFSSPPAATDFDGYHLPDLNKEELFACRPGRCSYKMPAHAMEDLRTKVDWSAADAQARAEAMVEKLVIARLVDYERRGDPALAVYYDSPSPYSVADGLHSLLGGETRLWSRFPDLLRYAEHFPNDKPPDTDDFMYWQEAAFGLKHVVRLEHVMIQKLPRGSEEHYAIVSKMLFATHYFRAAIEFSYVYPVKTNTGEPAVYFASAQRSYVDGLTGAKGAILRKIAEGRSPKSLAENLELAKQQLEKGK